MSQVRKRVYVTSYGHIDCLKLILPPELADRHPFMLPCSEAEARQVLLQAGWEGDGVFGAIWLPPFLFSDGDTWGSLMWHGRQQNDGLSWLCAREPYQFGGLKAVAITWQEFPV
jgi:hypothetical protein